MEINKELIYKYFDRQTDPQEMETIKSWTEASDENLAALLEERKIYDASIVSGKQIKQISSKRNKLIRNVYRYACASLLVIGVMLGLGILSNRPGDGVTTISVPPGQRTSITLPDGSLVWLNAGTVMTYASDFEKNREVQIDGMAYFDVVHDEKRPFVVHTFLMDIQVLGTTFDVNADSNLHIFETALMTGSVHLSPSSGQGNEIDLDPHQKVVLNDGKFVVSEIESFDPYKWKEGLYCFRDKRFSEIIADLERYYDQDIIYEENPTLEKTPLTGKFRIADGLDYALQVLQAGLNFKYTRESLGEQNYIHITTNK